MVLASGDGAVSVGVRRRQDRIVGVRYIRMAQAERSGEARAYFMRVRMAGCLLDDQPGDEVVDAVVLLYAARRGLRRLSQRPADHLGRCPGPEAVPDEPFVRAVSGERRVGGWQATRVIEELSDRHVLEGGRDQAGQPAPGGSVEAHTALGGELEQDRGSEDLGDASDAEVRAGVDGRAGRDVRHARGAGPGSPRTADLEQSTGHRALRQPGDGRAQCRGVEWWQGCGCPRPVGGGYGGDGCGENGCGRGGSREGACGRQRHGGRHLPSAPACCFS